MRRITLPTTIPCIRDTRIEYRSLSTGTVSEPHRNLWERVSPALQAHAGEWVREDEIHSRTFPSILERSAVRYRLRKLVQAGLLEERQYPHPHITEVFLLRPRGERMMRLSRKQRGQSPLSIPRPPRVDQVSHHLLTVHAAIRVLLASRGTLLSFKGDEDLRSESRRGRRNRRGYRDQPLPDGQLTFLDPESVERVALIEILTSKYTDKVILKKYTELPDGTIFATPTSRLANRMLTLTGYSPLLLEP